MDICFPLEAVLPTTVIKSKEMEKITCTHCGTENTTNHKYCFNCGFELPKVQTAVPDIAAQQPVKGRKGKTKNLTGVIVGIVAFALAFYGSQRLFFKTPELDEAMMKMASEINKSCPLMIDADTRLDNTVALPENIFQYYYTLVNVEKATADTLSMKSYLEESITNQVRTNPQMKFQRDHQTTLNYYYKDKDGSFLFLISVTPEKYE